MPHRRHVHSSMVPHDTINHSKRLQHAEGEAWHPAWSGTPHPVDLSAFRSLGSKSIPAPWRIGVCVEPFRATILKSFVLRVKDFLLSYLSLGEATQGKCLRQFSFIEANGIPWHPISPTWNSLLFLRSITFVERQESVVWRFWSHPQCKVWLQASCSGDTRSTV